MITLAIDTSTPRGSVAIFAYGEMAFEEAFMADRSHSSSLFAALDRARAVVPRFHQVAVGLGPGSYAGIRIAIAAACGFELVMRSVLVGMPSVVALETGTDEYIAIGDARREAFYFTHIQNRQCVDGPLLVTDRELRTLLDEHHALPYYASAPMPAFASTRIALPSAAILARLADGGKNVTATCDLEPIYLREPHITQPKVV